MVADLETEHRQSDEDFTQRKLEGINIVDAMGYETYLRSLENKQASSVPCIRNWFTALIF